MLKVWAERGSRAGGMLHWPLLHDMLNELRKMHLGQAAEELETKYGILWIPNACQVHQKAHETKYCSLTDSLQTFKRTRCYHQSSFISQQPASLNTLPLVLPATRWAVRSDYWEQWIKWGGRVNTSVILHCFIFLKNFQQLSICFLKIFKEWLDIWGTTLIHFVAHLAQQDSEWLCGPTSTFKARWIPCYFLFVFVCLFFVLRCFVAWLRQNSWRSCSKVHWVKIERGPLLRSQTFYLGAELPSDV